MEALTEMEKQVLARLSENPFATQQDLAEALGIPRPTLATHITQLTRKGYLLGRAYVLAKGDRIVCIGGCCIETRLITDRPIVPHASNPAATRQTFGGLARNVAEQIAKEGESVSLISMVGDDYYGRSIITHLSGLGVDTSIVAIRPAHRTATYTAVIEGRELSVGFSDMEIFDSLTLDAMDRAFQQIASATWVLADCNLPSAILQSLIDRRKTSRFQLAIAGVSPTKVQRLPSELAGVDALFLRKAEAVAYLARPMTTASLCRELVRRGARMATVSAPDFTIYAATKKGRFVLPSNNRVFADFGNENDKLVGVALCHLLRGADFQMALTAGMSAAAIHPLDANGVPSGSQGNGDRSSPSILEASFPVAS